jgi:pimeloyl-ACP methyl ester carboxylesterase
LCPTLQKNTHDSIGELGLRLAQEVAELMSSLSHKSRKVVRLSFVGHSLGTLIIRAALTRPEMTSYLPALWLFISISGSCW